MTAIPQNTRPGGGDELVRLRRRLAELSNDNHRLRHSEQRLKSALGGGRLCWWTLHVDGSRLELSDTCKALFGRGAEDAFSYDDLVACIVPADRAERQAALDRSLQSGEDYEADYRVVWPNGEEHGVHVRGRPLRDAEGRVTALTGVALDATRRRRAEARDRLLRDELTHRLKNTLTTVQALASQTLRTSDSAESFRATFGARLEALGRGLALFTDEASETTTLRAVLMRALEPYVEAGAERFRFDGPELPLPDRAVTALSLVAHELATNAMKYGALSNDAGRVHVAWSIEDGRVHLIWRESGGPPVTPPARRGFGSRLIQRAVPLELHGEADVDYAGSGLVCRLRFPA